MGTPSHSLKSEMAPDEERYRSGEVIRDRYNLVRRLGEGGFGTVWVAHDALLDVHVAVKIIYLEPDAPPTHWERLLQEARAAARFRHPAIVRVFDFGQTDRRDPFVAMELLHGETLYDTIRNRGRLASTRAAQLLLPIADALQTAHAAGIVHRDVKPENVFIAADDLGRVQPKLLDFGIARHTRFERRLTAKGAIVGTPDYMSPEQARGESDVGVPTDVWSFCVMLYEALCGTVPFTGENYNALLTAIINDDPAPTTRLGAGDADLWRLIDRGMKKNPDERWESMRAVGEALALWLYERGVREDACATSLRTSWLEADFAEIKMDLNPTLPPLAESPTERPAARSRAEPLAAAAPLPVATPAPHKRWLWVAVAGAAALAAVAALLAFGRTPPEPSSVEVVQSEPPAVSVSAEVAAPVSMSPPAPPASEEPPARRPRPTLAPTQPAAPAPPRTPKPKPTATAKPSPDFGF